MTGQSVTARGRARLRAFEGRNLVSAAVDAQPNILNTPHTPGRATWSQIFDPDGRLKRALNVRANRHPSYTTQIWSGYGALERVHYVRPTIE